MKRLSVKTDLRAFILALYRLIFERMYGHLPEKLSNTLKIRYWRTGRSTPSNRAQCMLLAEALELSDSEWKNLIQEVCDLRKASKFRREEQLLIRLLDLYEEACSSMDAEECLAWFQEACRILDACFAERGHERLQFMHFKAQDL